MGPHGRVLPRLVIALVGLGLRHPVGWPAAPPCVPNTLRPPAAPPPTRPRRAGWRGPRCSPRRRRVQRGAQEVATGEEHWRARRGADAKSGVVFPNLLPLLTPQRGGGFLINSMWLSGERVMRCSGSKTRWLLMTIIYSLAAKDRWARSTSVLTSPGASAAGVAARIKASGEKNSPLSPGRCCARHSVTSCCTLRAMSWRTVSVAAGKVHCVCSRRWPQGRPKMMVVTVICMVLVRGAPQPPRSSLAPRASQAWECLRSSSRAGYNTSRAWH